MKMSDALRAAAETAPVDDVHVSTGLAARRVRRNRALRTGANSVVGVGAAALVVAGIVGVISNQTALTGAAENAADGRGGGEDIGVASDAMEPGFLGTGALACGQYLDASGFPTGEVASVATLGDIADGVLPVSLAFTSDPPETFAVMTTTYYVLWDGIIVGSYEGTGAETSAVDLPLVNCWDGAALPAADYTLVAASPITPVELAGPPVEEPTEPGAEEPAVPEPGAGSDGAGSDGAQDPDTPVSNDAAVDVPPTTYAVTDPVTFTVPGEPVENPFEEYLKQVDPQPVAPEAPDDALTVDAALDAYNKALLTGKWDMAPGTQRVVLTDKSTGDSTAWTDGDWATSYYGCPWDGGSGAFPSSSASLDWLSVKASIPSAIHVSYGWIVDDNPPVSLSVTNTSQWSLPGFYGGAQATLFLVKDGKVVAEAYPVSIDQQGGGVGTFAAESAARSSDVAGMSMPYYSGDGYLASGDSLGGNYVWRDLYGCWDGDSQSTVGSGTYTVLNVQNIYVGGGMAIAYEGADTRESLDEGGSDDAFDGGADIATVDPDQSAYASFQVWTSLGTVTVAN